ncbi:MAG: CRISPR-associated endonuclease Cas3'', partial [Eubacteriales bacterium]|nr:CRISPR-associated endonuclease Cas3'' [Eubacteriales bacterium]
MDNHYVNYYAHSNGTNKAEWELLKDHLNDVSNKASELCDEFGFSELGKNVGYLHDIGKYQKSFQDKIRGENVH